jgi:hypothetical protein
VDDDFWHSLTHPSQCPVKGRCLNKFGNLSGGVIWGKRGVERCSDVFFSPEAR